MFKRFYPYEYFNSVFDIDYAKLYQKGFRAVIFDIDNTLVHHGDDSNEQVDELFRHIHSVGLKTLLLSNNNKERIERFIKNIDTVYIEKADKPKPDNYYKALEMLGCKKEQAVVIQQRDITLQAADFQTLLQGIEPLSARNAVVPQLLLSALPDFHVRPAEDAHPLGCG